MPGVITSTSNYVEHPAHVAELLSRYIGIVGADRVIAGTDCGFGTFAGIGKVDPAVAYKKLARWSPEPSSAEPAMNTSSDS